MSAKNFADLHRHINHRIECVGYGRKDGLVNMSLECTDCNEVLLTFDKENNTMTEGKEEVGDLQTIIAVGDARGTYVNQSVEKEFEGKLMMTARPDGAIIVHDLNTGVRPLCYIAEGAEISLARNVLDAEIEVFATTADGQQLTIQFTDLIALHGVPTETDSPSLAMSIMKCVFDMGGNYGRTTCARVLTGSVSKKVLTINISKLGTYGVAKDASMKEVLALIDWLIEEGYIAYAEDSEFPVIIVTPKGLDILGGCKELPIEAEAELSKEEIDQRKAILKEWREKKAEDMPKPKFF